MRYINQSNNQSCAIDLTCSLIGKLWEYYPIGLKYDPQQEEFIWDGISTPPESLPTYFWLSGYPQNPTENQCVVAKDEGLKNVDCESTTSHCLCIMEYPDELKDSMDFMF